MLFIGDLFIDTINPTDIKMKPISFFIYTAIKIYLFRIYFRFYYSVVSKDVYIFREF